MNALEKLKSRGYWHVIIRPADFSERRLSQVIDAQPLVEHCAVNVRGWPFPYVDPEDPPGIVGDFIEQSIDWSEIVEYWRMYQSAQFIYYGGLRNDWTDRSVLRVPPRDWEPHKLLSVGDSIYTITEFFEFAARLSSSLEAVDTMHIEIHLHHVKGRRLWIDDPSRAPLRADRMAQSDDWQFDQIDFSQSLLLAQSREIALAAAQDLFRRFSWDADTSILRSKQDELRW